MSEKTVSEQIPSYQAEKEIRRQRARTLVDTVLSGAMTCHEAAASAEVYVWEMYDAVMEREYEWDGVEEDEDEAN